MIKGLESKRKKVLNVRLAFLTDLIRHTVIKYDELFEMKVDIKIDIFRNEAKQYRKTTSNSVKDMMVLSEDRVAVIMENDKDIKILNLKDPTKDFKLIGHKKNINCICIIPNNRIVSGSDDGIILVWDLETQKDIKQFRTGEKMKLLISIRDSNSFMHIYHGDITVYDLDQNDNYFIRRGNILCADAISSDKIALGGFNSFALFDMKTRLDQYQVGIGIDDAVYYIFSIPDHNLLILGLDNGRLIVFDFVKRTKLIDMEGKDISDCALLPNNKVVISFLDGKLTIFDCITKKFEKKFTDNDGFIKAVDTLSDGRIISAGRDHYLKIWG